MPAKHVCCCAGVALWLQISVDDLSLVQMLQSRDHAAGIEGLSRDCDSASRCTRRRGEGFRGSPVAGPRPSCSHVVGQRERCPIYVTSDEMRRVTSPVLVGAEESIEISSKSSLQQEVHELLILRREAKLTVPALNIRLSLRSFMVLCRRTMKLLSSMLRRSRSQQSDWQVPHLRLFRHHQGGRWSLSAPRLNAWPFLGRSGSDSYMAW